MSSIFIKRKKAQWFCCIIICRPNGRARWLSGYRRVHRPLINSNIQHDQYHRLVLLFELWYALSLHIMPEGAFWDELMSHNFAWYNWLSWPHFIRSTKPSYHPTPIAHIKCILWGWLMHVYCSFQYCDYPPGFWADSAHRDMAGMTLIRTLLPLEVTTEAPEHPPRSILSTDVNILGMNHAGCLIIASGRRCMRWNRRFVRKMAWFGSLISTGIALETMKLDRCIDGGMVYAPIEFQHVKASNNRD